MEQERLASPSIDVPVFDLVDDVVENEAEGIVPAAATDCEDDPDLSQDLACSENNTLSSKRARYEVHDMAGDSASSRSRLQSLSTLTAPQHVASEALRLTDVKQFKFPWEKGRLASIFDKEVKPKPFVPSILPGINGGVSIRVNVDEACEMSASLAMVQKQSSGESIFEHVVIKIHGLPFVEDRQQKREQAVKLWWNALVGFPQCHEPGRLVSLESSSSSFDADGMTVMDACFSIKSPNTLLKRFYALQSYFDWLKAEQIVDFLPFTELKAWNYLQFLKNSGAPATKSASFLEAVRFSKYVLNVDGASCVLDSLRIKGLSAQLLSEKRPWRPADVLQVKDVLRLHEALNDETICLTDRVIVGHFIHMLYARARWSDLVAVQNAFLDAEGAFFEVESRWHKNARSADIRAKLLPIVAPAVGIDGKCWAATYLQLRDKAGLALPQAEASPMLPAPLLEDSQWSRRHLTSQEGDNFLRRFFQLGETTSTCKRITTHSMKSTGVSWCAKMGVCGETRAVLARHQSATLGSTMLYSRDIVSAALREFTRVIHCIYQQEFHPDRTRSGMLTPVPTPATPCPPAHAVATKQSGPEPLQIIGVAEEVPREPSIGSPSEVDADLMANMEDKQSVGAGQRDDVEDDMSSESSSSTYESDDDPAPSETIGARYFDGIVPEPAAEQWWINVKSLVIHATKTSETFVCGRKLTQSYNIVAELNGLKCSRCFPN